MVLAISFVMIGVVATIYNSRKRVVNDDAANQIASAIQTVRNEAQQGLGPTNGATFAAGETLFGEAIEFRNDCGENKGCLRVYKLKASPADASGNSIISTYEQYDIKLEQDFGFSIFPDNTNCTGDFITCYSTPTNPNQHNSLSSPPINAGSYASGLMIVARTGSSQMYAFRKISDQLCEFNNTCNALGQPQLIGPDARDTANYTASRSGVLRLATGQPTGAYYNYSSWSGTSVKYYLNIDLAGNGQIKLEAK